MKKSSDLHFVASKLQQVCGTNQHFFFKLQQICNKIWDHCFSLRRLGQRWSIASETGSDSVKGRAVGKYD
jgi:hypothetical protein